MIGFVKAGEDFNASMLALARKYREVTQLELSQSTGISQAQLSKIEQGLQIPSERDVGLFSLSLGFPSSFFYQNNAIFPPITPFHRKRAGLSKKVQERVEAFANLKRQHLLSLLNAADLDLPGGIPKLSLEDYDNNPLRIAQAVRGFFHLPRGPISNVTDLLENHGVFVFIEDLGNKQFDGFTLIGEGSRHVVFLNGMFPGDHTRLTLAHELGHIVMHEIMTGSVEEEAWAFASEFLMPSDDIYDDLKQAGTSLPHFADLKRRWKVSMAALIRRSNILGITDANQYRYLMQKMAPYRVIEPVQIPQELPSLFNELFETIKRELEYSEDDLIKLLRVNPDFFQEFYAHAANNRLRRVK